MRIYIISNDYSASLSVTNTMNDNIDLRVCCIFESFVSSCYGGISQQPLKVILKCINIFFINLSCLFVLFCSKALQVDFVYEMCNTHKLHYSGQCHDFKSSFVKCGRIIQRLY